MQMQRATAMLRTCGPVRSFVTSSSRQLLAKPGSGAVLAAHGYSGVRATPRPLLINGWQARRSLVGGSDAFKANKDATYSEIEPLTKQPTDDVLIIDVREPDEVALGNIPSSVNLPLSNFEKALDMDDSDFVRAYGFRKPGKGQKMIFYCKAGIRAASATGLAKDKGWKNVRNYPGSYAEWEQKQQKKY